MLTVEVQAKLGKDVITNLTQQLNAVQINLNNVKVDQTAINNMISQFNTAFSKVNINLGNINTNGATQSAQKTGQQIGNQLGNSINQSLQANLNHVKQDIQNIFSSFSVQKLNNADIFKNFNLNRAKIDPSVTKDVQSLTAEINKLAREALKTNSDSAWEGITQKISNLSGANWEAEVLSGRQQTLANFTSEYEKLCQRQADATVNAYNTEVQAAKNAAAGIASVSSSVASSGGGSSSGGSSGGSSSSTHKVTYDKNNNPNKPALKSNDYWTYEKLSKKGYSTSGQASSHISDYASKGANGFTQIGNKYFIVKWIANAGSPANASKAKNKLEKDNPKKIGKYGYAKRYHKGLELGKIEALPKDKAFDLVQDIGTNGLESDEVPIIAKKGEAVITEEQIENLAKTLHLVPVQNEIMEKMSKISLGDLPMNTPKMNFDASKVGQSVTKNNFAPNVNITFNCPNLTNESGVQYVEKAMDKYMNKFANDFYQASLHYVNRKQ